MKVSLVTTVKDAAEEIEEFLDSLRAQTRAPDEVVVVDGGSSDGTFRILQRHDWLLALRDEGANISRGRNLGIRAATHDTLALTDGDCVLAPEWLERLLGPLERGASASAGFYRPLATSLFQTCAAAVSVPEPDDLAPGWMPSSRSIAFRREAWEAAGGYPEWLDVGEDMYFNHRLRDGGIRMELAPDAVAYWRIRPTVAGTWHQYSRYAEGDAMAAMYPQRHAVRFATYGLATTSILTRRRSLLWLAGAGAVAYARKPIRRAWRRLDRPADRLKALVMVPAMMAVIDGAKMWGYVRGLARSRPSRREY